MAYRRRLRVASIAVVVFIAVLAAMLFGGPMLLDIPTVRAQIQQELAQAVNGQMAWDSLHVRLLPSPRGILRDVRVDIPGKAKVTMEQADVYLRLSSLLFGRAEISSVSLTRPVIELDLAPSASQPPPSTPADPIAAYRASMSPIVQSIRRFAPDSVVSIDAARVAVHASGIPPLELRDLSLRARTGLAGADLEITTASSSWGKLHLVARVEFADLSGYANLEVSDLKAQPWLDRYVTDPGFAIAIQTADLHARARTDAKTSLQCDLELATPSLQIARNQQPLEIAGVNVKAAAVARAHDMQIDVREFHLGSVLPSGQATLKMGQDGQHPQLSIRVGTLDLAVLRDAALALARDIAVVAEYAPRVGSGEITDVHMSSVSDTWSELFDPPRLKAGLTLAHGVVLLPTVEQQATELSARVELADGTVGVESIGAQLGNSKLADGRASYALKDQSVSADVGIDIQLAQALDLARKVLPQNKREQLDAIVSASGRLPGRVQAKAAQGDWNATIAVAQSDAAVRLKQLPWPVALHAARAYASARQVTVSGLRASLGRSTLDDAATQIALGSEPKLVSATARATLALGELYPWLREQKQWADGLRDLNSVSGTARVTLNRLTGGLDRPAELQYDFTVQPQQVIVVHEELPAAMSVASGAITIDPMTVKLDRVALAMLDAHAALSGTVSDYRGKRLQVDASIADGAVGPKAMQWTWERAGAPARFQPKTPLRFTVQRALWGPDQKLDAQAAVQFEGGHNLIADLAWKPNALELRRIVIKDRLTDATIGLTVKNRLLHTSFSGTLNGRSVAALLKDGGEHPGVLDGDLQLTLDLDLKGRTTAQGHLSGRALDLSRLLGKPVHVNQIDLEADGETLRIRDAVVDWAQQVATISGEVKHGARGAIVNAQIDSPGIVIDALLPEENAESAVEQLPVGPQPLPARTDEIFPRLWPLPITGRIKVRSDFIQYQQFRVMPVVGAVTLEERRARVDLTEAQLCGISFPLTLDVQPHGVSASARIVAGGQQLEGTARCFSEQRVLITGGFDLRADLSTSGRRGQFARNLKGSVQAEAHDGSVMKFAVLGNILAMQNVAGLFRRGPPHLGGKGFAYSRLAVRGHFDSGNFIVEESAFDSDAVGLVATGRIDLFQRDTALTVLVAPFSRLDRLVRKIPVVGYVVGGTFTSVPVGVSGDIRDPIVIPLGPQAITTELAGIFERTLKLPGRLVAPLRASPEAGQPSIRQ